MDWEFSIALINLDRDVGRVPEIRTKTNVRVRETTRINFSPLPYPLSYSKEGNKLKFVNVESKPSGADVSRARS